IDVEEVVGAQVIVAVGPAGVEALRVDDDRNGRALRGRGIVEDGAGGLREAAFDAGQAESNRELDDRVTRIDRVLLNGESLRGCRGGQGEQGKRNEHRGRASCPTNDARPLNLT